MATTRSSIPRLLRAAAAHRTATTLLRHHHHTIPSSLLHSHPSNLPISNPDLLSTSITRSVHTRATTLQNPRIPHSISHPSNRRQLVFSSISRRVHTALDKPKNPYSSIWPYTLTLGCIATGMAIVRGSMNQEVETRYQWEIPDVFREGHSVVIEGFISPEDGIASQYCFSATQVLAKPKEEVTAAMERNMKIIVEKLDVDCCEKGLLGCAMTGKVIIKDAADPSKSNSKGSVNQIALHPALEIEFSGSLDSLDFIFWLQSLPHLLGAGHSVVVKGFVEQITDETEEDKLDEIKQVKSDEFIKDKSAKSVTIKTRDREYHFSAEIKYIPTNAAAIEWNITESLKKLWRSVVKSSGGVSKSCG